MIDNNEMNSEKYKFIICATFDKIIIHIKLNHILLSMYLQTHNSVYFNYMNIVGRLDLSQYCILCILRLQITITAISRGNALTLVTIIDTM